MRERERMCGGSEKTRGQRKRREKEQEQEKEKVFLYVLPAVW